MSGEGDFEHACEVAWRAVEMEPWQEEARRDLMRQMALSGQRSEALAQYEICRRLLAEKLGVEPTVQTTELYQAIQSGTVTCAGL